MGLIGDVCSELKIRVMFWYCICPNIVYSTYFLYTHYIVVEYTSNHEVVINCGSGMTTNVFMYEAIKWLSVTLTPLQSSSGRVIQVKSEHHVECTLTKYTELNSPSPTAAPMCRGAGHHKLDAKPLSRPMRTSVIHIQIVFSEKVFIVEITLNLR